MVKQFIESSYKFEFADSWNVIKYDDHRYYKSISGQSMSGVDFAGLKDGTDCYLIEVKNYKQYTSQTAEKDMDEFIDEISDKVKDSIQLIEVIQKFLNRKFLYRFAYRLVRKYPVLNREWYFWTELYRTGIIEKQTVFVLFIDAHFSIGSIQQDLEDRVGTDIQNIKVISLKNKKEIAELGIDVSKLFRAS